MKGCLNLKALVSFLLLFTVFGSKMCFSQVNLEVLTEAQNGDPEAQFEAGKFYFESYNNESLFTKSGKKNPNWLEAEKWFLKATEQGHIKSKYYLSQMSGEYYKCDINCLKQAALEGIEGAQYTLGGTYLREENGTPKDLELAYKWISLALKDKLYAYNPGILSIRDLVEIYKISHLEISKGQLMAKEHTQQYGNSKSIYLEE